MSQVKRTRTGALKTAYFNSIGLPGVQIQDSNGDNVEDPRNRTSIQFTGDARELFWDDGILRIDGSKLQLERTNQTDGTTYYTDIGDVGIDGNTYVTKSDIGFFTITGSTTADFDSTSGTFYLILAKQDANSVNSIELRAPNLDVTVVYRLFGNGAHASIFGNTYGNNRIESLRLVNIDWNGATYLALECNNDDDAGANNAIRRSIDDTIQVRAVNPDSSLLDKLGQILSANEVSNVKIHNSNGGQIHLSATGDTVVGDGDLRVPNGDITTQGLSVVTDKNFRITHPLDNTKYLKHTTVEAPAMFLIYSGMIQLQDGTASVNLDDHFRMTPGTFEAITKNRGRSTSNETGYSPVKSSLSGNTLTITCQDSESTDLVAWIVTGERADANVANKYDSNGNYQPEFSKNPPEEEENNDTTT